MSLDFLSRVFVSRIRGNVLGAVNETVDASGKYWLSSLLKFSFARGCQELEGSPKHAGPVSWELRMPGHFDALIR